MKDPRRFLSGTPPPAVSFQRLWEANNRRGEAPATTSVDDAARAADLEQLRVLLDEQLSYRHLRKVDLDALLASARQRLGAGPVSVPAFALEVDRIIAAFGDGHAGVRGSAGLLEAGSLPFLMEQVEGGLVAFEADRSALVDPKHPYVVALDGEPIEDWLTAAASLVNRGSPQYERRGAIRALRALQHVRGILGVSKQAQVRITLADNRGRKVTRALAVASRHPTYGAWPRGGSRILEGDIGYLRIASMDSSPAFLAAIDAMMKKFAGTVGLIVDLRGNGGGSRAALRHLFPYLMAPDDSAHVANIAACRLQKGQDPHRASGYLDDRFLYPANWSGWSDRARTAIAGAARAFEPEWRLPRGQFSGWHYMVLERTDNAAAYHYTKPVIVLMNADCFSATDIFLGGLAGWHGVTLLGTPSGGGSGRSQSFVLSQSRVPLRLSSMASFRPNGQLYDGNGVAPDVVVQPRAADLIGNGDTVLEAAVARLRR